MPIVCSQCGHTNRETARFCGQCRTPLGQDVLCSSCGTAFRPGAKYCRRCGAPRPGLTGLLRQQFIVSNRYRILQLLARGGMGAVYLAQDARLGGKRCAVKEMSDQDITDPTERQQAVANFQREAQLLAQLDHPNIPKVHDCFTEGGRHYLVMDYVEGNTLQVLLDSRGNRPFAEAEVQPWLEQLCDVLSYLHAQRPPVIFRDLKPSNIMVDQRGAVKLIDFGIARFFLVGKAQDTQALGTVGYAAPEAFARRQTDVRSDIYSLGATVYQLVTGYDPTQTPMNLPPVHQLSPTISAPMEQVITRALQHDPNRRWQSVEEIRRHLGTVRQPVQPPIPVPPAAPTKHQAPARPTTKLLLAMAQMSNTQLAVMAGGLLVLFAVGTWLLAPVIKSRFPLLWRNFPLYLIAGPLAYAAARRRGTAFAAHVPISSAVWWILHTRFGGTGSFWPYIVGLVLGGAVEEGWGALETKEIADIWWQDCLWFAAMTSLAVIAIKMVLQQAGLDIVWIGEVIGAALVGALGWFIGDLYQQHLYLRQTGVRRSAFR